MRAHPAPIALLGAIAALSAARPFAAPAAPDACSLLTTAQVSAAVGTTLGDGKPVTSRGCVWRDPSGKSGKRVVLTVLLPHGYEMGKTPLPGVQKSMVSGVGDEAFYKYFDEPRYDRLKVVDLLAKKGESYVSVEVGGMSIDDGKAKTKELALELLPKL